ncbi:MAG: baseplate J/gp47 family protein [Armatimonadota bacterium]|nr:baseplate J/gp47 family protein [bacterium]
MSELQFITTDVETIAADNIALLESEPYLNRNLYPGDPVRNVVLALSYVQAVFAQSANHSANQSFLDQATGTALDALGVLLGVTRRTSEAARTTLRFSLGAARGEATLIPLGTRATVQSSGIYWATIETVEIPVGDTYIDVIGEASEPGPGANGYLTGEINTLVDSIAFVTSVTNLTASSDGSEAEDDASLRERIREAPTRFSVGGPEDAYVTLTKDARADVESVSINSPDPRVIDIYFTLTGGAIPASETIDEVEAYLNDKYRRPMSDVVNVDAPTPVNYTISLTYYIRNADSARAAQIQADIATAVDSYVLWQRSAIGRDVNPSELIRRVMDAGALRVTVTNPAYDELTFSELAVLSGTATLTNGGLDDE